MNDRKSMPHGIFDQIIGGVIPDAEQYTYIILGKTGPTGKSRLCKELREAGYNAHEITESIFDLVEYNDDKNHFIIDENRMHAVIVLNRNVRD